MSKSANLVIRIVQDLEAMEEKVVIKLNLIRRTLFVTSAKRLVIIAANVPI
jgi:hypothetical protein